MSASVERDVFEGLVSALKREPSLKAFKIDGSDTAQRTVRVIAHYPNGAEDGSPEFENILVFWIGDGMQIRISSDDSAFRRRDVMSIKEAVDVAQETVANLMLGVVSPSMRGTA